MTIDVLFLKFVDNTQQCFAFTPQANFAKICISVDKIKFSQILLRVKVHIYSEEATKFYEISTLLLTTVHTVKSKVKILQNVVALSECMILKYFSSET